MSFIEIQPKALQQNVFQAIGDDWMLITAGNEDQFNTMTASWGGMGVLWNNDVVFAFVRPTRYTYEFMEREDRFSLCFFGGEYRKALQFCGTKSGRQVDKVAETGLTPLFDQGVPYFAQARTVLICRKWYFQDLDPAGFLDPAIARNYTNDALHRLYVGKIEKVLVAE